MSTKSYKSKTRYFNLSNISKYLYSDYLLSRFTYRIANNFDYKVYEHFAFMAYFFCNSIIGSIIFIYLYAAHLFSNPYQVTLRQQMFSFSFEPSIVFIILLLLFLLTQIVLAFLKFDKYKVRRVSELARFTSKINVFKLVVSEYNWRISSRI